MPKPRMPLRLRQDLLDALEAARMTRANFDVFDRVRITIDGRTRGKDEFIKQESRIYRETWIIPRLQRILAWANGEEPRDE